VPAFDRVAFDRVAFDRVFRSGCRSLVGGDRIDLVRRFGEQLGSHCRRDPRKPTLAGVGGAEASKGSLPDRMERLVGLIKGKLRAKYMRARDKL
jgi:hypothetical protein